MSATPREPAYRKRVGYHAGLLGGFATMAAVLLLIGDILTRDAIQARQLEDLRDSLAQVIPTDLHDNQPDQDVLPLTDVRGRERQVYRASLDGRIEGVAFQTTGYGYAGAIDILLGIDRRGRILGVRVLAHAETPGLGDKIEIERDDWILDFNGRSLESPDESRWKVRKDGGQFEQFSGATITPRAVVGAVADGLRLFRQQRERLLAPTSTDEPEPQTAADPASRSSVDRTAQLDARQETPDEVE